MPTTASWAPNMWSVKKSISSVILRFFFHWLPTRPHQLWFTDLWGQKLERASDIFKILFLKKNFRMTKNFGASEKIYFIIFKIYDFGINFEASDVCCVSVPFLLPVKWTILRPWTSFACPFSWKKNATWEKASVFIKTDFIFWWNPHA